MKLVKLGLMSLFIFSLRNLQCSQEAFFKEESSLVRKIALCKYNIGEYITKMQVENDRTWMLQSHSQKLKDEKLIALLAQVEVYLQVDSFSEALDILEKYLEVLNETKEEESCLENIEAYYKEIMKQFNNIEILLKGFSNGVYDYLRRIVEIKKNEQCEYKIIKQVEYKGKIGSMCQLICSPSKSSKVALLYDYKNIEILDINTKECISCLSNDLIGRLIWSPDGSKLAFQVHTSQSIKILDANNLALIKIIKLNSALNSERCKVLSLGWSPDGSMMAISLFKYKKNDICYFETLIYDIKTEKIIHKFNKQSTCEGWYGPCVGWSPDNKLAISWEYAVNIYEYRPNENEKEHAYEMVQSLSHQMDHLPRLIQSFSWSPDSSKLAIEVIDEYPDWFYRSDARTKIFNVIDGTLLIELDGEQVKWNQTKPLLICCNVSNLEVIDTDSWSVLLKKQPNYNFDWLADGSCFLSSGRMINIWKKAE